MRALEEWRDGVAWTLNHGRKIRADDTIPNHLT
jgi:hypothetical protein